MPELHEAMLYKKGKGNSVKCGLCRRHCTIAEGSRGNCGVRKNVGGKLYRLLGGGDGFVESTRPKMNGCQH